MKLIPPTSRRVFLRDLSRSSLAMSVAASVFTYPAKGQDSTTVKDPNRLDTNSRVATGELGVVATVNPLASQAAMQAYQRGGNAIDAAVAASLMLSVVDGHNSGIGGGCLALVYQADGRVVALDGREMAPGSASPEMFFRAGQPAPELSQLGPLAAGVPGLLATLERLSREHGQIDWNEALLGAAEVAEAGFVISEHFARVLRNSAEDLKRFPASARVLLDPSGQPWSSGHLLRQPDLAQTLRQIAEQGIAWFYHGEFAELAAAHLREAGGVMAASDFANYETLVRRAIQTQYRGDSVIGFPPPSSGGIHDAQMLGMLAEFDVAGIFAESEARGLHLLLEVMKRAMADRAYWLGDADFAKVPRGLLDQDYLRQLASSVDLSRATEVKSHGQPPRADVDLFGQRKHTTHLTTADARGNVVAITQTVNTSFGCKMIVPGTGVVLNNEMDDFSIAPGVRNAFGLLGSEANVIAPGKRPLSSMSPTIVLDDDRKPILSCGAAGGPKIITTVLQVLVRVLDLGESIQQAIAAPRVHHQWSPDVAVCENALDDQTAQQLANMGHKIQRISSAAVAQGISLHDSQLTAAADPRVASSALGY
ncbi:MAG: gamma-glutamyltransferase [Pirellulaceae bacterium]|nr:gamma-glutamyltransferase [Pirellulaceae bacterium]